METWTTKIVEDAQAEVKARISAVEVSDGPKGAIEFCKREISRLSGDLASASQLLRLIYCISALYQHRRHDLLSRSDIRGIYDVAQAILISQQIRPTKSRLAFLYGDLHRVMGQIDWQESRFWRSALELTRSSSFGKASVTDTDAYDAFAMFIRLDRLGMHALALKTAAGIDQDKLTPVNAANLQVRRMRILWLSNHFDAAREIAQEIETRNFGEAVAREVAFEKVLMTCIQSGNFRELYNTTRKGAEHYELSYVLEARLWFCSLKTREFSDDLPTIDALSRRVEFKGKMDHALVASSKLLDLAMDEEHNVKLRFDALIDALE